MAGNRESRVPEPAQDAFGVVERDIGIGDDGDIPAEAGLRREGADLVEEAGLDANVVGAGAEVDGDSGHGGGWSRWGWLRARPGKTINSAAGFR